MRLLVPIVLLCAAAGKAAEPPKPPRQTVIVVVGAEGAEEFREPFRKAAERWRDAAAEGGAECLVIGLDPETATSDRDRLQSMLVTQGESSPEPLWLVLIGHGTFNGKLARFSLRGPDISSSELGEMLKPVARPLAIADCTSCSAPFLMDLSARGRVVLSATRSGHEYNFSRFGDALSQSIADPAADLDKDGQTSLLEAFLLARIGCRSSTPRNRGWRPNMRCLMTTETSRGLLRTGSRERRSSKTPSPE